MLNNSGNILEELDCITSIGTYTIDSESDVRRTTSLSLLLDNTCKSMSIENKIYDWIGLNFELQIGIYSIRNDEYIWYKCGHYLITDGNTTYDASNNSKHHM